MAVRPSLLLASLLLLPPAASADLVFTHSGLLLDASDAPVTNAALPMTFRILSTETGTGETPVWTGSCNANVRAGHYAVTLGAGCGAAVSNAVFPAGSARYLEVVANGIVLAPRHRLGAVPTAGLAERAITADTLGGRPAGDFALAAHTHPATEVTGVATSLAGASIPGSLELTGSVRLGTSATCDASTRGALRWTGAAFEGCGTSGWAVLGSGGSAAAPALAWSAGLVDFGTLSSGVTERTLTLTNNGSGAATSLSVITDGSFTRSATTCGTSLAPGGTCTATAAIALSPVPGTRSGWIMATTPSGGSAVALLTAVSSLGTQANPALSCNALLIANPAADSRPYWLDPNGPPATDAFQTWCDMATDGGGWTLVLKTGDGAAHAWSSGEQDAAGLQNLALPTTNVHHKFSDATMNALKNATVKSGEAVAIRMIESQTYNVRRFGKQACTLCTSYADACDADCLWVTDSYSATPTYTNLANADDWKYYLAAGNVGATYGWQRLSIYGRASTAFHYGWVGGSYGGTMWVK